MKPKPGDIVRVLPINALTGEIGDIPVDGLVDGTWRRRGNHAADRSTGNATRYSDPYVLFFRDAFPILARIPGSALALFWAFTTLIDPKTEKIRVDFDLLAAMVDVTVPTVRNRMSILVKAGLIKRWGTATYGLNPKLVWCGGAGRREQLIHQQQEQQ